MVSLFIPFCCINLQENLHDSTKHMSSLKLLLLLFFFWETKNLKPQISGWTFHFWFSKVVPASRTQKIWKCDMRLASWPKLTTFKCSIGKRNTCEPWFFKATELYFFLRFFYFFLRSRDCFIHWPYVEAVGHNFSNMVFGVKDDSFFNLKSMTLIYEDKQRVWFSTALSF